MLFTKRNMEKRSKEEKERILKECQKLGIVAGCRKNRIAPKQYYRWLERYQAHGIDGLIDRRSQPNEAAMKRLEKENKVLKEILAEKELELRLKDELLKKKRMEWRREKK